MLSMGSAGMMSSAGWEETMSSAAARERTVYPEAQEGTSSSEKAGETDSTAGVDVTGAAAVGEQTRE